MIQEFLIFCFFSAVSCSLLPKEDLLGNQFGAAVHNIDTKYFLQDKPVVIQTTDIFSCSYRSNHKVHHEQKLFELLTKQYQQYVKNDYKIKAESAVIMLPHVDIHTQMKLSSHLFYRISEIIGNILRNIVLLSPYVSRTKSEQEQVALDLLNEQWKSSILSEVIVLLPEVGWSFKSQNKLPEIEVFAWFVENQRAPCL